MGAVERALRVEGESERVRFLAEAATLHMGVLSTLVLLYLFPQTGSHQLVDCGGDVQGHRHARCALRRVTAQHISHGLMHPNWRGFRSDQSGSTLPGAKCGPFPHAEGSGSWDLMMAGVLRDSPQNMSIIPYFTVYLSSVRRAYCACYHDCSPQLARLVDELAQQPGEWPLAGLR